MEEEIELGKGQKDRNIRFISNLYTNIVSCIVSLGRKGSTYKQLSSEGWKLGKIRYASARKRQLEETYTNITPTNRGRVDISDDIQQKIREEWIENSRAAANLVVKDPSGGPERPGSRLIVPALQVALKSKLVRTKYNPDG